ncbi:phage holin family protein [Microbacterium sp. W1N]|uniref:phage holin family protein n=1 Tax=Microbacterium festucae TaxID=2977531 RepID=UPI0021C20ACD|nr:phage holin family protein [Microbacterium festucae]MCT9818660.1 phage holin family protein [Microbacterium festucae]
MIAFLLRALVFLASAAIGLIVADLVLPGFHIAWRDWWGFLLAIVLFAVLQSVLTPIAQRLSRKHAPLLLGGIGILSTFVAIVIVVLIPAAGLSISEPLAWIAGPAIVWLVTALATWLLTPLVAKIRPPRTRA